MKKSLIALAVAGVTASSAFAVIDLDNPTTIDPVTYASENDVSGTGIEITIPMADVVTSTVGFSVTASAERYFRYDLSNGASFIGDPVLSFGTLTGVSTDPADITIERSAGGDDNDFVLFEVSVPVDTSIPDDAIVTLAFSTSGTENLRVQGTTTITYELFANPEDGGTGNLAGPSTGALTTFSPATDVNVVAVFEDGMTTPEAALDIDVADDSLSFEMGADTTALGTLYATLVSNDTDPVPFLPDGTEPGFDDIVDTHEIVVSGDFAAADSVFAFEDDGSGTCAAPGVTTITADIDLNDDADDTATFDPAVVATGVGSLSDDGVATALTICMTVDGETPIQEGSYTGEYLPVAQTGFTRADVGPFPLATLGNTGTTLTVQYAVTPNGNFNQFVRITNPTTVTGRVFFTLVNDAGEVSESVDLIDVTTLSSRLTATDTVPGNGSSALISVNEIWAAVQEVDDTFDVGSAADGDKLRVVITGEFGEMDIQSFAQSKDKNSFNFITSTATAIDDM